jgi:hypothetical protein
MGLQIIKKIFQTRSDLEEMIAAHAVKPNRMIFLCALSG